LTVTGLGDGEQETVNTLTVIVFVSVAVPPAPVQFNEYVVETDGDTVTDPDVALPVEKLVPVQLVAFADDQVTTADCPADKLVGLVTNDAVTTGP
jgi:hypothetical protein